MAETSESAIYEQFRQAVGQQIKEFLVEPGPIKAESAVWHSGLLDVAGILEQRFGIRFDDDDFKELVKYHSDPLVDQIVGLVWGKLYTNFVRPLAQIIEKELTALLPLQRIGADLGGDSLSMIEFVEALEEQFKIKIDDDELAEFDLETVTLDELYRFFIAKYIAQA